MDMRGVSGEGVGWERVFGGGGGGVVEEIVKYGGIQQTINNA